MIISQGLMRMKSYEDIEKVVKAMDWPKIAAGGEPHTPFMAPALP